MMHWTTVLADVHITMNHRTFGGLLTTMSAIEITVKKILEFIKYFKCPAHTVPVGALREELVHILTKNIKLIKYLKTNLRYELVYR